MKRIFHILLALAVILSLTACGTSKATELAAISPNDYDAINKKHMSSLLVGMIISMPWQNANELDPSYFIYYYASALYQSGVKIPMDDNGFIPAEELEPYVQKRFDVTTEHLRSGEYYSAEKNGYEFGGLGSSSECKITSAERNGKQLTIDYDITGPMEYKLSNGKLLIEFDSEDYLNSENYKYLSNQYEWSAQRYLCFPSAMDETDKYGVFMMNSGGKTSTSSDGVNWKRYNGEDIASIVAYYEDEALPSLEAVGKANTTKYEDGWYWSGTYRGGKPLTIDIQHRYGADTYIITALYIAANPDIANNMRSGSFMQPPNLNNFSELFSDYLWRPYYAGVLDGTWSMAENADVPSLVRLYAHDTAYSGDSVAEGAAFPADEVESYVRRYFDVSTDRMRGWNVYDRDKNEYIYTPADVTSICNIVSATSYGGDNEGKIMIALAYDVRRSEDDDTVIWSGELTIELSGSGYKYISNNKYFPEYPITQDAMYLDDITRKYVRPLNPTGPILIKSWATPEDIPADDLINFCAFNNLLKMPRDGDLYDTFAEFINNHAPAAEVEAAVRQYFDVPAEYLRTAQSYGFVDESGERYDNEYIMFYGFGGGAMKRALHTEQDGDLLKITVGLYGPDDETLRPAKTGLLTVRLDGDTFQYLSYALEQ